MRDSPERFGSENSEQRPSGEEHGGTACHGSLPVELRGPNESSGHDKCRPECSRGGGVRTNLQSREAPFYRDLSKTPRLTQVRTTVT